jgi:hypothetical protein
VLTPQMLDVVIAAAQSLTFTDLGLLRDDDLPSPSGTVILPRPLITRLPTAASNRTSPSPGAHRGGCLSRGARASAAPNCRRCGCPATSPPPAPAERSSGQPAQKDWQCRPSCSIPSGHFRCTRVTPSQARDCDLLAAAVRRLNAAYWQNEARRNPATDQAESTGEYASGAILDEDQDGTLGSRFLYAFWRLCEQNIAARQAARTGHTCVPRNSGVLEAWTG